ncbi:CHAT domain-containing protein [Halorussus sp. AFM4]|uniref:CHAT domain-containing protein n=1 Tax=Halorussus sp. AFM4 TaxID=3421651 RepID=UPI003EBE6A79
MRPRFDRLDDRTGLAVLDPIEKRRFVLYTAEAVSPAPAHPGAFAFPVSAARRIAASAIELPYNVPVAVREAGDGAHVRDAGHDGSFALGPDDYLIEVSAPVKLYLRVSSSLAVEATTKGLRFEFGGETPVELGARSHHDRPAATVTVPDDPEAVMAAVSTFGSALKTTSCERSWPNLRGHPPAVRRGDELAIPDDLDVPDTGVTLRVPADYEHVYPVVPLAYYLGADVVPGDPPRLTADTGFVHPLDADRGFEAEVIRVLKRVFMLDCAVRTEGFHPMDTPERRAVESSTDLDLAALYGAPLGDQVAAYLSVPRAALADATPTWSRVTHVRPEAATAALLPFVADDLSLVRVKPDDRGDGSAAGGQARQRRALRSFKRGPEGDPERESEQSVDGLDLPADADPGAAGVPDADEYVPLPGGDAVERAWVGEGTPVHGAKLLAAAFDRDRSAPTDGVIDVTVVCNDDRMREEGDAVSAVYGAREGHGDAGIVPFDVDCRFDVSTGELRSLLADDCDLFHFIGHVDGRGLACRDGLLDAETLSATGATTVLLNACRSHDQGVALVEAGARAAIVSWGDVDNRGAVEVGETFARLLNYGFGVGSALELVEEHTAIGRHYVVVGDPTATVAQCADGNPLVYELACDADAVPAPDEEVPTTVRSFATDELSVGAAAQPHLRGADDPDFYLVPGRMGPFAASGAQLRDTLADYSAPVVVGGRLRWSDEWYAAADAPE